LSKAAASRGEYSISPSRQERPVRRGKALTADYVLECRNRKLAVDEAIVDAVA
jgi:hypothetical protein